MESCEVVDVESDGEGLSVSDTAVFRNEIDKKAGAFQACVVAPERGKRAEKNEECADHGLVRVSFVTGR